MKFAVVPAGVLFLALAGQRNAAAIPCAATVQELRVSSTAEAAALTDAVNCTGGQFFVQWSGHVSRSKILGVIATVDDLLSASKVKYHCNLCLTQSSVYPHNAGDVSGIPGRCFYCLEVLDVGIRYEFHLT